MSTEITYDAGQLYQTETERVVYYIDVSPHTGAPTNPEVHQVIDETSGGADVTATVMPTNISMFIGSAGTTMQLPLLRNLEDGHDYRVECRCRGENAQFFEFHLRVKCRGVSQDPIRAVGDDFTDDDDTSLSAHTATGVNGGFTWTVFSGNDAGLTIQGNQLVSGGSGNQARVRANHIIGSDQRASITIVSHDEGSNRADLGLLVRKANDDTITYYEGRIEFNNGVDTVYLVKLVAGTGTELDSDNTITWADGDVLKLEVEGTSLKLYQNDVVILSTTDSDITSGECAGLFRDANSAGPEVICDNWTVTSHF
jgi:hypothetical protein